VDASASGSGALAGWPVVAATAVTLLVGMVSRRPLLTIAAGAAAITLFTLL
jgi:hypothetical protein